MQEQVIEQILGGTLQLFSKILQDNFSNISDDEQRVSNLNLMVPSLSKSTSEKNKVNCYVKVEEFLCSVFLALGNLVEVRFLI